MLKLVAMNAVPQVEVVPETLEKLDEIQGIQQIKMSVEQRKEMLFQQLELSDLEGWSDKNQAAARVLQAEYHNIFTLEPRELGCTDMARHETKVIDDEPFKVRFWIIPPSMVDEVCAHVKEMPQVGAIHPSQSPWCNATVLVCKKDEGVVFCINFCKLNVRTKKDSLSASPNTRSHQGFGWYRIFLLLGFESWFLANSNGGGFEAVYCFHCREPRVLQV